MLLEVITIVVIIVIIILVAVNIQHKREQEVITVLPFPGQGMPLVNIPSQVISIIASDQSNTIILPQTSSNNYPYPDSTNCNDNTGCPPRVTLSNVGQRSIIVQSLDLPFSNGFTADPRINPILSTNLPAGSTIIYQLTAWPNDFSFATWYWLISLT